MKLSRFVSALLMLVLGILFIVQKAGVLVTALWIFGIVLIVAGVLDILTKNLIPAIVKIALGAFLVIGNGAGFLVSIAIYIIGAVMIVLGAVQFFEIFRKRSSFLARLFALASAVLYIVIGVLLFLGNLADWIFIVIGVFMIIDSVLDLAAGIKK